jgi:hypothetical protein
MDAIEPYREFVRRLYDDKDPGHDFRHIERIISRLDELKEGVIPPPSPYKLNFLACFHGLGKRIQEEPELKGNTITFLHNLGWNQDDIDASLSSLVTHLNDPKTAEEMIVHDANYFEVAGALGIAKAFIVGGARGQTIEETIDIYEGFVDRVVFRTPVGKRLYGPRKEYAREFLQKLKEQV